MRKFRVDPVKSFCEFTVEGRGEFPFDMLRYDMCWPKSESRDSVALSVRGNWNKELRRITLVGLREPTTDRWKSFGWNVVQP